MTFADEIEAAICANPACNVGLLCTPRVLEINRGPSGGPELLTLAFADEQHRGYWYGHIRLVRGIEGDQFVSVIARLNIFVNAPTVPLLFQRFDYWTRIRLKYEPCTVQNSEDAFRLSETYSEAVSALSSMLLKFDYEKRSPEPESAFYHCADEMRILEVFGMEDFMDADGSFPAPPMPQPLRLVRGRR